MRTFITVSHTVPPDARWGLDDLAGAAGRVDLVCRNVQAALFTSHGIRRDTRFVAVFAADAERPRAVRIDGGAVRNLHPDERSTAARLRKALQHAAPDPWWEEVEPGVHAAPFDLRGVVQDAGGTPIILHKDGDDGLAAAWPDDPVFLMGDHVPLTEEELAVAPHARRISLGDTWLHGNHVTAIVQWLLDRKTS